MDNIKLKEGIWMFLNKIKGHSIGYGSYPEIRVETARRLFSDLFGSLDNQTNQALEELRESGQIEIDRGWVKSK